MPKFDDFDLDVNSRKLEENRAQTRITSVLLCTPGTCNDKCPATAWLCSNVCITKTCLTCA